MPFPYSQQTWTDGVSSASAARMTVIEAGVALAGVFGTSSSPPGSPSDGMIWRLPADTSSGRYWFFQYDSSQTTYKWVFMGGSPMTHEITTSETTASTSYADLATVGPTLTLPRAGDYLVEFGALLSNNNVATSVQYAAVKRGSAATSDNDSARLTTAVSNGPSSVARALVITGMAASDVVKMQYKTSANTESAQLRWMKITPIRVI